MKLPPAFLAKMERQLGCEFPEFLQAYTQPRTAALRANRLKISPDALQELLPFLQERVPWCADGFYFAEDAVRPAKHPYYHAGLYYIQEPSAMLPAELLHAEPGQRVLDLCAAPGGKSVQLAGQLGKDGLLVVNDPHPQRAKILLKNIERYGIVNAVVLNETPDRLRAAFSRFFDKILVDAPCSGEGMFRKEPDMANAWSEREVAKYAGWQAAILAEVPALLRPGGEVVYSTCTFSEEENERQVARFVAYHPEFEPLAMHRLWPHRVRGEGHFAAKLKHTADPGNIGGNGQGSTGRPSAALPVSAVSRRVMADFSQQLWGDPERWQEWLPAGGTVVERAGHLLWESDGLPPLRGLKVLRSGWLLGTLEKGRFRPSIAYALGLPPEAVRAAIRRCDLSAASEDSRYLAIRYLRGETLELPERARAKGWQLVTLDGYPLGWAKGAGGWLKNEYPPGWRWQDREEQ